MENKKICPTCGKTKKPWFKFCWECTEKENQKPKCEICDEEVPEGHTLCKTHWIEKQNEKKKINQVEYVKNKKEIDYRTKYEGSFFFGNQRVKSKSELLICYFLKANDISFTYERPLYLDKDYRPDFTIDYGNKCIILEHFGLEEEKYKNNMNHKIQEYKKLCSNDENFEFIYTTEKDIQNLSDNLGKMFNNYTSYKKPQWK